MDEIQFKFGDVVNHKFIGTHKELLVVFCEGNKVVTRYFRDEQFYTNEFFTNELEHYVEQSNNLEFVGGFA